MASCKCCCFMQPLAQLSPSAFATRDAWPWATLFWDAEGLGKSVAKETSLPWSQPQFRPPRGGDRAVTAVQPWAAGMGGQHWSMDWTLNTMSVAIPARANAKQPVVCLSVCLLRTAALTAWLVSLRTRRALWAWAMLLACSISWWEAWGWPWWWHWSSSATSLGPSPSEWNSPRTLRTSNLPPPPTPRITLPTEKATTCTAQKVWKSRGMAAGRESTLWVFFFLSFFSCLCCSVVCTRGLLQEALETPSCGGF